MFKHNFRKAILACGAESKGVYVLAKEDNLFISKDFGNLSDYNNFSKYEKSIKRGLARFNIKPKIIACDMHPDYNSTAFAEEIKPKDAKLIKVQHHHAHIASCMHDNGLKKEVIGIAFDGTGYGVDGNIWGGEFLLSSFSDFERVGHLKYIPMPGGERAITEPWRMAAAYLYSALGDDFLNLAIPFTKRIKTNDWELLKDLLDKNINSPLTSSIGRLFDAIASMLLCVFKVNLEAEAAIRLERYAQDAADEEGMYKNIIIKEGTFIIDPKDMVKGIVKDIKSGKDTSVIAAKFHNTIANVISDVCIRLKRTSKLNRVVLSGGVFQNRFLTQKTLKMLKENKFDVYTHKRFSTTDAGIPIGQVMVAGKKS